ncbi:MAG: hypothetical protein DRI81_18325 [Chloroflexi bacterium]|nr:MAG: hypothetical protein DRI81_18325 [Chloroflexota bacterium]
MNVNSKTIGIGSVVGGVLALLLAPFVTYASLITGIGIVVLAGSAMAMGQGDDERKFAIVGIGLGVVVALIGIVSLVTDQPLYLVLAGG